MPKTPIYVDVPDPYDDSGLQQRLAAIESRVSALEAVPEPPAPEPEPEPQPDPPPPPPAPSGRITTDDFELIGGWVINQPYARGGLAIDFDTMEAYTGGHAHNRTIDVYQLGQMGQGADPANWPVVSKSSTIDAFWPKTEGASQDRFEGFDLIDGILWACPRGWFSYTNINPLGVFGLNLATNEVTRIDVPLSTQAFGGGFIKGHPADRIIGSGGYISGQGSVAGPTAAKLSGEVLLSQVIFNTIDFDQREKRPPTVVPASGIDGWIAFNPRNGVGAWGADSVHGGGIWTDRGVCYWPQLGTGVGDYNAVDKLTFSDGYASWLCTYDGDWKNIMWSEWHHGPVVGSDVDSNGVFYLLCPKTYQLGQHSNVPTIKVFKVKR